MNLRPSTAPNIYRAEEVGLWHAVAACGSESLSYAHTEVGDGWHGKCDGCIFGTGPEIG